MRISDWSSDVCSSDLRLAAALAPVEQEPPVVVTDLVGAVQGESRDRVAHLSPVVRGCCPSDVAPYVCNYTRSQRARSATPSRSSSGRWSAALPAASFASSRCCIRTAFYVPGGQNLRS